LLTLVEPRELRLLVMEEPPDGIKQHVIGGSGLKTIGFFEESGSIESSNKFMCHVRLKRSGG
jgi:hypothetical protein